MAALTVAVDPDVKLMTELAEFHVLESSSAETRHIEVGWITQRDAPSAPLLDPVCATPRGCVDPQRTDDETMLHWAVNAADQYSPTGDVGCRR